MQSGFDWKRLSLIAGAGGWHFNCHFFSGAIEGPQIVEYHVALHAALRGNPLAAWNGLPAHRSAVVRDYVEPPGGHIQLERMRACAPEPRPVEYLWGYASQRELANDCVQTVDEVKRYASRCPKAMRYRPALVRAF